MPIGVTRPTTMVGEADHADARRRPGVSRRHQVGVEPLALAPARPSRTAPSRSSSCAHDAVGARDDLVETLGHVICSRSA